jgi:hypothetical protein
MTPHPPTGRHPGSARLLLAALAVLAAALVTQSVPPPAGASATPTLEITLLLSVMAELDGAGLVITGAGGATLMFTRTVPAGDPPMQLWGSVVNGNVLIPTVRPGDPDPWTGQPTGLARGHQGVDRAA